MSGACLFGKLPTHGDFVARGLFAAERDALDAWLSAEMLAARAALGEAFEERYDQVPPWRFAGPAGAGALVASIDAAGRRFPLYIGLAHAGEDAAAAIEELVYRAFGGRWNADTLAAETARLNPAAGDPRAIPRWWTLGGEGFPAAEMPGDRPIGLLASMLLSEVQA